MVFYKLTLLKDLPEAPAGFSFSASAELLKTARSGCARCDFPGCPADLKQVSFDRMVRVVLLYHDNPEWVKIEIDFSKAISIQCPYCKETGMFACTEDALEVKYFYDVTRWYAHHYLFCPRCEGKVETHRYCVRCRAD